MGTVIAMARRKMKNITQPAIQTQANIPAWALNVYRWIGVCVCVCVCVVCV